MRERSSLRWIIPTALAIAALYFLIFLYLGGAANYLPLWLEGHGWSETAQGWLWSLRHLALIVFPLLWGRLADRRSPAAALRLITAGSALAFTPLVFTSATAPVVVAMGIWAVFRVGVVPVADALTLTHIEARGGSYAGLRVFGSIGFIAGGLSLGAVVWLAGRNAVPYALLAALGATCLLALTLPGGPGAHGPERLGAVLSRLRGNRPLRPFLAMALLYGLITQGLYIFLPLHLGDLGVSDEAVPVYWSLGVLSEIVLFRLAPRTFERLPPRRVLLLCALACVLQYALTAVVRDPGALLAIMLLHGMSFGIFYYTCVVWLGRAVPAIDRGSAQAVFQSVTFGVGGALSAVGAGYLFEHGRGGLLFGVAAGLSVGLALLASRLRAVDGWGHDLKSG